MKISLNRKKHRFVLVIFFILILLIVIDLIIIFAKPDVEISSITESVENGEEWKTYTNTEFNFKVDFPSDWKVYEDFERTSPIINIYKSRFDVKPPFDQFSNIDAVLVFPRGVETEALIGETIDSEIVLVDSVEFESVIDYVLKDGQIWATYITFEEVPESWKSWGSVWARSYVENIEFTCRSGEDEIDINKCDPFGGDTFVREGETDVEVREIQERILESFEFIK